MNANVRNGLLWCSLTVTLVFAGCNGPVPVEEPPPVEVVVCQPQPPGSKPEMIADWDVYTGTVDSKESVEIRSRVRGHITDVQFKEGAEIPAGSVLFLIDPEPFKADLNQAKGQLGTWEAKLKLAEEKIALYKPLVDKGTVSKEDLLKVFADKGEAIGGIDTAKAKIRDAELNIGYCKITAPIAGKVGEAILTKGNLANSSGADSLLTRVIAVDPMYVNFSVHERAYQKYRRQLSEMTEKDPKAAKGDKVEIPVEMAVGGEDRFPYKGFVDFVDNRVDPATGSIKVRAKFDNPKGPDDRRPLTAGMFARVRVKLGEPMPGILVADRAILTDQSLKYVLVVNKAKKNVVERVDIVASTRLQESGMREVKSGLKGDEWVIVEGVNRARPGVIVDPKEGNMPRRPAAR
jgi:RND family efflux transporter MFP subunit